MDNFIDTDGNSYTSFESIKRCPICGNTLIDRKCKHGCFADYIYAVFVFTSAINTYDKDCEGQVMREIAYWKENDRYLMKILEG